MGNIGICEDVFKKWHLQLEWRCKKYFIKLKEAARSWEGDLTISSKWRIIGRLKSMGCKWGEKIKNGKITKVCNESDIKRRGRTYLIAARLAQVC